MYTECMPLNSVRWFRGKGNALSTAMLRGSGSKLNLLSDKKGDGQSGAFVQSYFFTIQGIYLVIEAYGLLKQRLSD